MVMHMYVDSNYVWMYTPICRMSISLHVPSSDYNTIITVNVLSFTSICSNTVLFHLVFGIWNPLSLYFHHFPIIILLLYCVYVCYCIAIVLATGDDDRCGVGVDRSCLALMYLCFLDYCLFSLFKHFYHHHCQDTIY